MNKNILKPKMMASGIRVAVVIAVFFVSLVLTSCGGGGGSSSSPAPVTPDCEKYNTAEIRFQNRSATGITMDIIWNGSSLVRLFSGDTSQYYTVSAGVTHTLLFRNAANGATACTQSQPTLSQCSSYSYWCTK